MQQSAVQYALGQWTRREQWGDRAKGAWVQAGHVRHSAHQLALEKLQCRIDFGRHGHKYIDGAVAFGQYDFRREPLAIRVAWSMEHEGTHGVARCMVFTTHQEALATETSGFEGA